ncbi:unnamed protein product [Rotaria socialis]|uniref:Uncharacterized protein n=1 Tax=Rotaria socialis TaxID=392032 RepID=A0A817PQV9_9BILA|nr:unnamed protein product [Rotaria socialis]
MSEQLTTNNHTVAPLFSPAINDALQNCDISRSNILTISSETEVSTPINSVVQRLLNAGIYINDTASVTLKI